ncbi:MAG: hypothetical protein WC450_09915 [Candidatus Omnitrophota bacterium]|jgi:hypothetical protein
MAAIEQTTFEGTAIRCVKCADLAAIRAFHQLNDNKTSPLPPFARNSETSRQAAIVKYDAGDAECQRDRILRALLFASDGLTREEIETETRLDGNTVRPRVRELMSEAKGWQDRKPCIRVTGRTRPTRCGRQAEVLEAI